MSPLHPKQLSFKAINQQNESNSATRPFRFTFGAEVTLDFARYALGYNFKGLEQGLINVLRAERGIPAGEPVPVDALTMFAFSLGASTDLVDEWVSVLSDAVAPYAERTGSFVIRDAEHKVIITVEDRVVMRVEPMKRRLR